MRWLFGELSTSRRHLARDIVLLGVATVTSALLAKALYVLAVYSGLITANDPCGTYLQSYTCVMINPLYQLVFLVSGGTIGFLFYFVNVMHKSKLAFRMELVLALDGAIYGVVYGVIWLGLPRYDPSFSETASFTAMFIVSVAIALATFLAVDHQRSKNLLARHNAPAARLQNPN